jgi:hypothetical protein
MADNDNRTGENVIRRHYRLNGDGSVTGTLTAVIGNKSMPIIARSQAVLSAEGKPATSITPAALNRVDELLDGKLRTFENMFGTAA